MKKKKKPRKGGNSKYQQYSRSAVEHAYNAVVLHKMTVYKAAKRYKIPYMTLSDKIHGKRPLYTKLGRKSLLQEENEVAFADHVTHLFTIGYGFAKADFLQMATDYALHLGKPGLKGPGKIGKIWYYNFLKKYPDVVSVRPFSKHLCVTREAIVKYYNDLEGLMEKYKFLMRPESIFIMDKVEFDCSAKLNVSVKEDLSASSDMGNQSSTVMFIGAGNCKGVQIPGYLVFTDNMVNLASIPSSNVSVTEKSWLSGDVLKQYFLNTFLPCAHDKVRKSKYHLLVLYDPHKFILCPGITDWLMERNIVLFPLPPHVSLYQHTKTTSVLTGFEDLYTKQISLVKGDVLSSSLPRLVCEISQMVYNKITDKESLKMVFSGLGIVPYNAFALNRPVINAKVKQAKWTESQRAKKRKKIPETHKSDSESEDSVLDGRENETQPKKRMKGVGAKVPDNSGLRRSNRIPKKRKFSSSEEEEEEEDDFDDDDDHDIGDDDHDDHDIGDDDDDDIGDDNVDYNTETQNQDGLEYIVDVNNFSIVGDNNQAVEIITNIEVNENVDLEIENIDASAWIDNEPKCCTCCKVEGGADSNVEGVDWVRCAGCSHWTHFDSCTASGQFTEEKFYCTHCVVCA